MKKQINNADQHKIDLQALKESNERFLNIVLRSPDAIIVTDAEGKIKYMNPAAEKVFNRKLESFIGNDFGLTLVNGESTEIDITRPGKDHGVGDMYVVDTQWLGENAHLITIRDITERKEAEEQLRQQTDAMDAAIDGMAILNEDGKYVYLNKAHAKIYGYENQAELIGKSWRILYDSEVNQRFEQDFMPELSRKGYWHGESIGTKKNGSKFPQELTLTAIANGGLICVIRDITERKRADEELKESEKKYRLLADNVHDVIFILDMNLKYTYISPSVKALRGYEPEEVLKQSYTDILTPSSLDLAMKVLSEIIDLEKIKHAEITESRTLQLEMKRKDGTTVWTEVKFSAIRDKDQWLVGILGITRDITERKRADEALLEREEQYRLVVENAKEAIIVTQDIKVVFVNRAAIGMIGYSKEMLTSKSFTEFIHPDDLNMVVDHHIKRIKGEEVPPVYSFRVIGQDGTVIWCELNAAVIQWKEKPSTLIFLTNITERKQADEQLKESEKKYRLLADNVDDVIFVLDMNLNCTYASPSVKILMGYEQNELLKLRASETMTPSSWDLATKNLSEQLENYEQGEIPKLQVLQLEMRRKDGSIVWAEVKVSFLRDENQRPVGIIGVTRDITERRKAEAELKQTLDSLNNAVGVTIQVMVSAVEMRDPYTAGHQLRVANIACAIATEMGLSQDKIEGLRMAGSIHDIGKLSIPAEILSKPTKLTNIEFSLIKEHSQTGYDMLKDVESPWPLAQIVYQHHERMDGSGYPRNLKGDEILMEARIMAVADVVEAMASRRPYRPGLGIDVALAEIEKNKGTHYDNTVADACLKLFREKGYKLEQTLL